MWLLLGGWWFGIGFGIGSVAKYMRGQKVAQHSIRFDYSKPPTFWVPRCGCWGARFGCSRWLSRGCGSWILDSGSIGARLFYHSPATVRCC